MCVCLSGGRIIRVSGQHLDVVQEPRIRVTLTPLESHSQKRKRRRRSSVDYSLLRRERRIVPEPNCPEDSLCVVKQVEFTQVSLCLCFLTALNKLPSLRMSVMITQSLLDFLVSCSCSAGGTVHSEQLNSDPVSHSGGGARGPACWRHCAFPPG